MSRRLAILGFMFTIPIYLKNNRDNSMDNKLGKNFSLYLVIVFIFFSISYACKTTAFDTLQKPKNVRDTYSSPQNLYVMISLSDQEWIAFDENERIWKTFDRGRNWKEFETIPANSDRTATSFVNRKIGYHLVDEQLWKTTDGGEKWKILKNFRKASGEFDYLFGVYFTDERNGWCVGSSVSSESVIKGRILRTTDGGLTWREVYIHGSDKLPKKTANRWSVEDIYFSNNYNGWAVGYGTVLYTKDGGNNWFPIYELQGIFREVKFSDIYSGIIKEKELSASRFTTDGGRKWRLIKFPTKLRNAELFLTKSARYILVEPNGKILTATSDFDWKQPETISEEWKSLISKNTFGNIYIGYSFDGNLVIVLIDMESSRLYSMISSNDGMTWH